MKLRLTALCLTAATAMLCLTGCGDVSDLSKVSGSSASESASAETGRESGADSGAEPADDGTEREADVHFDLEMKGEAAEYMTAADEASPAAAMPDTHEGDVQNITESSAAEDDSQPFVLTAGEWNDLENWGFFMNLVKNKTVQFPVYGLEPMNRISVTLTHDGVPATNRTVRLEGIDSRLWWQAKTDSSGRAYLFYPTDTKQANTYILQAEGAASVEIEIPAAGEAAEGQGISTPSLEYEFECNTDGEKYDRTEVMFILDTTGSMGDEISYLQKDFAAIAGEVADENMTFSVNFYRDEGDEYVTKCNPFTADVQEVQRLLNAEYADGGGDMPEAVTQILEETMKRGDWHEDTNKIAFLIFDAPPHGAAYDTEEDYSALISSIAAASSQGVHLIPVVASNAARETELFGRSCAIMTNSSYVFLTDDSGVGESHLEPIIGDYDVELLHDIIVRNIRAVAQAQ